MRFQFLLCTLVLVIAFSPVTVRADNFEVVDDNLALGSGYNTLTGEVLGDCVVRTDTEPQAATLGQLVIFSLQEVEDYHSLNRRLTISASGSGNGLIASGRGKAKFVQDIQINDYSLNLLASIIVSNDAQRMRDVTLKDWAAELLKAGNTQGFYESCGDHFVSGFVTGGEYHALLQIHTHSAQEKREISAKVSGSYGIYSASASFSKVITEITKNRTLNIYQYRSGGAGEVVQITPETIINAISEFPQTVLTTGARPVNALTLSYKTLPLQDSPSVMDLTIQKQAIEDLGGTTSHNRVLLANIEYVLANQQEFDSVDVEALNNAQVILRENLNHLRQSMQKCYVKISDCLDLPTELSIPEITLPEHVGIPKICNNPIYNLRQDPLCGVKEYNSGRDEACGVELYVIGTGEQCGVELYNRRRDVRCGFDINGATVQYRRCRHPLFGVEKFKECRDPAFGVEQYKLCQNSLFGVKEYATCRLEQFGVERCDE